jgi:transcriptional regulator with XRE-family HTH domain
VISVFTTGGVYLIMLPMLKELLASNLKRIREEKGISQIKLAELSGFSKKFISDIECERVWPSDQSLIEISKALKVKPGALVFDDELIISRMQNALKRSDT